MKTLGRDRIGVAIMTVAAAGLALTVLADKSHSAETAQAATSALKLRIAAKCKNGEATFKIRNIGTQWPKSSTFSLYRLGGGKDQLISKRRMRLKEGQNASFRVKASRNPTGRLGLYVQPAWYDRKFRYDAKLTCK